MLVGVGDVPTVAVGVGAMVPTVAVGVGTVPTVGVGVGDVPTVAVGVGNVPTVAVGVEPGGPGTQFICGKLTIVAGKLGNDVL